MMIPPANGLLLLLLLCAPVSDTGSKLPVCPRALVVINPGNPTGAYLDRGERKLAGSLRPSVRGSWVNGYGFTENTC